jgi:hypothetical protein
MAETAVNRRPVTLKKRWLDAVISEPPLTAQTSVCDKSFRANCEFRILNRRHPAEFLRKQAFVDAKIQIDLGLRKRVHRQLLGQQAGQTM